MPLASLVDVAMLGHYGGVADLAGVALGGVLFDYILWTFGFLRMGTTGLSAQALGSGHTQGAFDILTRGLLIGFAAGAMLVLLREPLATMGFAILEGSSDVESASRAYYAARIWGAPLALGTFVVHGFLLGLERGRAVLLLSMTHNLTNIALDYLLIAHLGLGAAGAGYATVASHATTLSLGLPVVVMLARERGARLDAGAALRWAALGRFLRLGGGILVRTFALITAFALFTDFSAVLGTTRLASNSLVLKVVTLSAYFVDGYAFSVESLAGQLHGARQTQPLRRLLALASRYGLATAACFATAFQLFPETLFGLLTDHPELIATAARDVVWLWPLLLVGSLAYVLDGYFLGLSAASILSRMMVLSLLVGFVPLALYARAEASASLLWIAFVCFTVARTASLAVHVPRSLRSAAHSSHSPS